MTPIDLFKIIKEGTKAVPATKYAIGIAGLVAIVSLIKAIASDWRVALWGTLIILGLMILLVVFAKLTRTSTEEFRIPAKFLMWTFVLLFITISTLLTMSVFFKYPVDLQFFLIGKEGVAKDGLIRPSELIGNADLIHREVADIDGNGSPEKITYIEHTDNLVDILVSKVKPDGTYSTPILFCKEIDRGHPKMPWGFYDVDNDGKEDFITFRGDAKIKLEQVTYFSNGITLKLENPAHTDYTGGVKIHIEPPASK